MWGKVRQSDFSPSSTGRKITLLVMFIFSVISVTRGAVSLSLTSSAEKEFTLRHNSILDHDPVMADFMNHHGSLFDSPPAAEIFVTRGDTEDTVPLTPDKNGDILITEQMVHNGSEYNHVVLACNSSYPVEWVYENGDGSPRLYTTQIRTFTNFHDPTTYGHSNIVVLFQERFNEQQTGTYVCRSVHKPEMRVGFHLFFTGEFGYPTMDNREVTGEDDHTRPVILPCATTDPRTNVELHKIVPGGGGQTVNLTGSELVHYDPRFGFLLKPSDFGPDVWGSYKCRTNGMESGWKVELLEPKIDIVRVYPHTDFVHMSDFSNHTFMCKAKIPIEFHLPNTISFGVTHYLQNPADNFPYIAVLRITPHVPLYTISNYFKINCVAKSTKRLLHTWEYSSFGPDQVRVSFEPDTKRLLCCTKSGLSPRHEIARCETDTDCSIKQVCFKSGRCDYAFPPRWVDAPKGCTALDLRDDIPSHVVKCSNFGGIAEKTVFITGNVEGNDVIMYDREVKPATEKILKIVSLAQSGNMVTIQCLGSLFYFSTNLVFAYEKRDGAIHLADEASIQDMNSYGPILHMKVEPDIVRVICFAPLTRSVEWLNVSLPIITVSSAPPPPASPQDNHHQQERQLEAASSSAVPVTTYRPRSSSPPIIGHPSKIITETRVSTSSSTSTSVRIMKISGRMRSRFSKKT